MRDQDRFPQSLLFYSRIFSPPDSPCRQTAPDFTSVSDRPQKPNEGGRGIEPWLGFKASLLFSSSFGASNIMGWVF